MNVEAAFRLGVALCCLFAVGTVSSSFADAVHTKPSDVIDVNEKTLPIGQEDAARLRDMVTGSNDQTGTKDGTGVKRKPGGDGPPATFRPEGEGRPQTVDKPSDRQGTPSGLDSNDRGDGTQSGNDQAQRTEAAGSGQQNGPTQTWWQRLLAMLRQLLGLLLGLVLLAALLAIGYHYRDRIRALLVRYGLLSDGRDDAGRVDYVPVADDDVSAAWIEMLDLFDVDARPSRTPSECASEAVSAGADASLVRALTDVYERTRYGGEPVTDERSTRARQALNRLRNQRSLDS